MSIIMEITGFTSYINSDDLHVYVTSLEKDYHYQPTRTTLGCP